MLNKLHPLLFFIILNHFGLAKTLYVDAKVTIIGDGTIDYPFKTATEAISKANSNDTINIRKGTYREIISTTKSLIIQGMEDSVYFTGTELVKDWEDLGSGLFKAYLPKECTQLFLNSKTQVKARFPNSAATTNPFNHKKTSISYEDTIATLLESHPINKNWEGATIWMLVGHKWVMQTGKIVNVEEDKLGIDYISNWDMGDGVAYITNTLAALDTVSEWHWQNDSLYFFLGNGMDIELVEVEAQTRNRVIELKNVHAVEIKNINTYGGNVLIDNSDHCILEDCSFKNLIEYHYLDKEKISWYSSYSRGEWTNTSSHGIGIGIFGDNNLIENCEVAWSYGDGITLYGNHNTVSNSIIHDANIIGADLSPISIGKTGNTIINNEVYNAGRDLIYSSFANEYKIKYNNVYNAGLTCWDLGGIYTWGTDGKKAEIAYNWVHNVNSKNPDDWWGGSGIYLDNNSSNYVVHHNVIWDCKGSGIHLNMPANNINVFNNTSFNCKDMSTYFDETNFGSTPSGNCFFTNNYIDGKMLYKDWLTLSNNISTTDEVLTDIGTNNFFPSDDSPLIDAGKIVNPGFNYFGSAVDIGAYEKNGVNWTTGPYATHDDGFLSTESTTFLNPEIIKIYPNPTSSELKIENREFDSYIIYNLSGQIIGSHTLEHGYIDVSSLQKGKYIINLMNNNETASASFIKK